MAIWDNLSPEFKASVTIAFRRFSIKDNRQKKIKNIFNVRSTKS